MTDDIEIRLIQPEECDRVLKFLRVHYYCEEPLTIGSEPKQQDAADEEFSVSNIFHGTCLMAFKRKLSISTISGGDGVMIGVLLAGPKDKNEAQHLFEESEKFNGTKWGNILNILACIERDANVFIKYDVTKALHGHVLVVDASHRGKSIGTRLMKKLIKLGRELNFPLLTADCTSLYTSNICDRLGMERVHTLRYDEYLDANGKQLFCPPAPHECVNTYAIRL